MYAAVDFNSLAAYNKRVNLSAFLCSFYCFCVFLYCMFLKCYHSFVPYYCFMDNCQCKNFCLGAQALWAK